MFIEIDFSSQDPIYQQLCDQIIMGIATNHFLEGETLPSVRMLADEIGINMHTVNKAYGILRDRGYVKVDRRRGAVVAVQNNKEKALEQVRQSMKQVAASAFCRGLSREELYHVVDSLYDEFEDDARKTGEIRQI